MELETLNKFHDAARVLDEAKWDIDEVAIRLHDVGLDKLCKPLWAVSKNLEAAAKMVRNGASEAINTSVRNAEQSSANMLAALFTGAAIKDPDLGDTALAFISTAAGDAMTVDRTLQRLNEDKGNGHAD